MAINEKATVEVQVNGEQAKKELKILSDRATMLKEQINEAHKAGRKSDVEKLTKELRQTDKEINKMKKDTTSLTEVMQNLSKATPKELKNTLKAINRELNSGRVKRGSAEWKYYQEQLKKVNHELRSISAESREAESWLTRFNNGFSKWGALAASAAAAVTGISMTLSGLRKDRDTKESAQANLKALTGLDDNSIAWLTTQAEDLSTTMEKSGLRIRQSADKILESYMLVGSKKPELLTNKEALNAVTIEAMRLAAAAKIDLKDAVEATTYSLNMFGADASQAARYVNVLAAGSKQGAVDVAAQTQSVLKAGVAAASAGLSIEELQGAIQALGEKGIEAEIAGTGLRSFFLKLMAGADETNPKVVGLQTALENLAKQNLSAADIQKRFGMETYTVASVLIDTADKVKYYTDAVTQTNIATEQAIINSDTNEAKRAQRMNALKEAGIELMERLNPSLAALTNWGTKIIVALPVLIDWFIKYKSVIIAGAAAVTAYTIAVNAAAIKTMLLDKWNKIATVSMAAFNAVTKANPIGLLLAAGAGLVTFLVTKLIPNTDKATDAQNRYNASLRAGKEEIERFAGIKNRYKNIDSLNDRQKQQLKSDAEAELAIIEDKLSNEIIAYRDFYKKRKQQILDRKDVDDAMRAALLRSLDNMVGEKANALLPLQNKAAELKAIIASIPAAKTTSVTNSVNTVTESSDVKDDPAVKAEMERYENELVDLKKSYINSKVMTQEEYNKLSVDLEKTHLENLMAIAGLEPEKREQIQNRLLDMLIRFKEDCATEEERAQRDELDREKKTADEKARIAKQEEYETKQRLRVFQQYGQEVGQMFAEMLLDEEKTFGDFLKGLIVLMLDAIEKMMIAYIAETTMKNVAHLGVAGLIKAAAETALITAAFETAKMALGGFEDGGFTGDGSHDQPQGIVHSNEFVANRHAVANPNVRPVLDLIDTAQRNNTVGSLTADDISNVSSANNSEMNNILRNMVGVIDRLSARLNEPFVTVNTVTGKYGIKAALDNFETMTQNKSRKL